MHAKTIAKNTISLLGSKILSFVLGFIFIMYTARYLGAEGYGILSFALAFTGMFGILADLGLSTLVVREVARNKFLTSKYISNIISMKMILSIVTFGLILLISNISSYLEQVIYVIYIMSISMILNSFTQIFYSIFQSYEKMEYQSLGLVLNNSLMLLGALIVIKYNLGILSLANLYLITSVALLSYIVIISLKKRIISKIEIDRLFCRDILLKTLPFTLIGSFILINQNIDRIMISKMIDMASVGWYSSAYNLVLILEFIPAAFITSIYPITSKFHTSKEKLEFMLQRGAKYLLMLGIPIGTGTTLLADKIILLIYGPSFIPSVIVLQILVWSEVLIFVAMLFNNLLISINKQISVTKQIGIVVLINIILNLILIPVYGIIGASITTVLSSFIGFTILYYYVSKQGYIKLNTLLKPCITVLIACLIMAVYIALFKWLDLFSLILSATFIYFIAVYLMKIFDEIDLNIIKSIIKSEIDELES